MKTYFSQLEMMKAQLSEVRRRMGEISGRACGDSQLRRIIEETLAIRGKMLRPALMLMCADMNISDELLDTAAVIELTHTASLLHDDVVDDAPVRRGVPTIQAKYGKCAAVYAGDYLLSGSLRCLMKKGFIKSAEKIAACVERMCDGEMKQLANRGDPSVTEREYLQAIEGKTAALFETACYLGGKLGSGDEAAAEKYAAFGREIGIMFQLRDDLLDWTGSEETAGKPVNEDFRSGVYTLPAIYTFASAEYGAELRSYAKSGTAADIHEIRSLVEKSGGIGYTESELCRHGEAALACLSFLPESENAGMLRELIL